MLKKVLLSSFLVCSMFLTSCNNSQKPNEAPATTGDSAKSTETTASNEKFTIWIPGDEAEYGFYFKMFENYKLHKESEGESFDYVIEQQPWSDYWTKLPLEVNQGKGPDMYLAHDAYMDDLMPISKELDLGSELLDKLTIKGVYVGSTGKDIYVPTGIIAQVMYANKELTGLVDTYPKTWAELEIMAKDAMANHSGIIGLDFGFNITSDLIYEKGLTYTKDGKLVFYKEPFEMISKWQKDGISDYMTFGNGSPEESFNQNAVAFIHGHPWMEFWAPDDVKLKMLAFPVPEYDKAKSIYVLTEPTFGISKNVSDEKYAVLNNLVKFMLSDEKTITEIAKSLSAVPNNTDIKVIYEPFTAGDAVLKTLEGKEKVFAVIPRSLEKIYKDTTERVVSGENIDTTLEKANTEAKTIDVTRLASLEIKSFK